MEEKRMPQDVPYIVFEGEMARGERNTKRLTVIIIILIALLAITNGAWLYTWNQYDMVSYDYDQDGEGLNNINNGVQGDLLNGAKIKDQNQKKENQVKRSISEEE